MASRSSFGTFNRFCNKRKASKTEREHKRASSSSSGLTGGSAAHGSLVIVHFPHPQAGRYPVVRRASPLPESAWIVTVSPKAVMRSALSTSSRLLNHLCCRYLRIPAAALPDDPHTTGEKARWDCRDKRLRRLAVRESVFVFALLFSNFVQKSPLIRRAGYLIALRMVNTLPVSGSAPPTFQYENCFHCRYPFYVNLRTS